MATEDEHNRLVTLGIAGDAGLFVWKILKSLAINRDRVNPLHPNSLQLMHCYVNQLMSGGITPIHESL